MVVAAVTVHIDWDNDNAFEETGGENVSARVERLEWFTGRDFASTLTGKASAGRLIMNLDNESGDYNSFNAASPIFGNLLPNRRVRVRLTDGSGAETMWQGFIKTINPQVDVNQHHMAQIEAVGPLAILQSKETSVEIQTSIVTGAMIGTILDEAGWPAGDRDVDEGNTTIERCIYDGPSALEALREIEETEGGFIRESRTGQVVFEDRTRRLEAPYITSQATFTDAGGGARVYSRITQLDPIDQIFNRIEGIVQKYATGEEAVLWTQSQIGGDIPAITPGTTWLFVADLRDDPTIQAVSPWTSLVSGTDYTANSASDGTGTDLTGSLTVVQTNASRSTRISITNNHGSLTAYITLLQARGVPITKVSPARILAENTASQAKYGIRTYTLPAKWLPNTSESKEYVDAVLAHYKDPRPLVSITVNANRNATHMSEVLRRKVSDRITIVAANNTELGINAEFYIESEHHIITPDRTHWVTWECSAAPPAASIWNLGVDALGTGTVLVWGAL